MKTEKQKIVVIGNKQSMGKDEKYCAWFICSACKNEDITIRQNYCGNCGAKIRWRKDTLDE